MPRPIGVDVSEIRSHVGEPCGVELLELAKRDLRSVQEHLGHRHIQTNTLYTRLSKRRRVRSGTGGQRGVVGGATSSISVCSTTRQVRHKHRAMNAGRICQIAVQPMHSWRTTRAVGSPGSARSTRSR